jgi:hypothetical protein
MPEGFYDREARIGEALVNAGERRWCDTCRKMSPITDYHSESHMERRGEVGYMVTDLECGHHRIGVEQVVGPAPGAPWAPDSIANLRPSTQRRARSTAEVDPWA